MEHLEIFIYGRVQGVSFRFNTKKKAKRLGVFGWIENREDGSVYIEAEGERKNLLKILNWCQKGPFFAKVNRVEHKFSSELKGFKNFEIKYKFKR